MITLCWCSRRRRSGGWPTHRRGWPRSSAAADVVAAEDTRRLRRLTADLGVKVGGRVVSYFEGNESARTPLLLEALLAGERVVLVTDAGHAAASPTPATGWSRRPSRPTSRSPRCPDRRRCSPRSRCRGCRWTGSASRASCRARPASGPGASARWRSEQRTMVFFEAPHRTEAALPGDGRGVGRRPAGGGVPRADQDPRGGTPRAARRARRRGRPTGVRGEVTIVVAGCRAVGRGRMAMPRASAPRSPHARTTGMSRKDAIVDVAKQAGRPQARGLPGGARR